MTREGVQKFFENYSKTAKGGPAKNIWIYDETNFHDNPGTCKAMFKKGTKYAERVMNSTKSAVSAMMCASGKRRMMLCVVRL